MTGLRKALGGLARRIRKWTPHRASDEIVIAKDLSAADVAPAPERLRLEPIDPELAPRVQAFARAESGDKEGATFAVWTDWSLRTGCIGYAVFEKEELIGYVWFVSHDLPCRDRHPHLARFRIALGPGDWYMYDLLLGARWRGKGRANEFVQLLHVLLRAAGAQRVWGYVRADNVPARLLYRTTGWRDIRRQRLIRLAGPLFLSGGRLFLRNSRKGEMPVDFRPLI